MTYVPNVDDIEFVREVPAKAHPFGETAWLPVLEAVKRQAAAAAERGEQPPAAVVGRFDDDRAANTTCNNLRAVTEKRGKWQVANRKRVVYLTYLGES